MKCRRKGLLETAFESLKKLVQYIRHGCVFEQGTIYLNHGFHEIQIDLTDRPTNVWLSLCENFHVSVCHGNIDKVSFTKTCHGFILYAEINSSRRTVKWIATKSYIF